VIPARSTSRKLGPLTARTHPDIALLGLGSSFDHALELITEIVHGASCPVIAILHPDSTRPRSEACSPTSSTGTTVELAIDITLQRFSGFQSLQGVSARRHCGDCPLREKLALANDLIVELQHQLRELRHEVENERVAAAWTDAALRSSRQKGS
jgi:hypothetical protein